MRKGLGVLLALLTAIIGGCASQASHYNADIISSVNACKGQSFTTKVNLVQCYDLAERPVIARDLPNILSDYDLWHSARIAASSDFDHQVMRVKAEASILLSAQMNTARNKFGQAALGLWQESRESKASTVREARQASSECTINGKWKSASMVVDYECDLEAQRPFLQRSVPAATNAFRTFHGEVLAAASEYDKVVLPVIQAANIKFGTTIVAAQSTFRSQVQLALQNDAAATARQHQDFADLLSILFLVAVAETNAHQGYGQPNPPLISTSCTTNRGITNCSSF